VADHPLRPATDRRLGGPLPHQLANRTSAASRARGPRGSPAFSLRTYAVLAHLSTGCPPLQSTFRCVTHPFATRHQGCPRAAVRLACVKHAASVQSEPGSNSSVQSSSLKTDLPLPPPAFRQKGKTVRFRMSTRFLALEGRVRPPFGPPQRSTSRLSHLSTNTLQIRTRQPTTPQKAPTKYPHLSVVQLLKNTSSRPNTRPLLTAETKILFAPPVFVKP
jgi:hypothetical protein